MSGMDDFRDRMALKAYGKTRSVAWGSGTCIKCNQLAAPDSWSPEDKREYYLSALCPKCYAEIMGDENG